MVVVAVAVVAVVVVLHVESQGLSKWSSCSTRGRRSKSSHHCYVTVCVFLPHSSRGSERDTSKAGWLTVGHTHTPQILTLLNNENSAFARSTGIVCDRAKVGWKKSWKKKLWERERTINVWVGKNEQHKNVNAHFLTTDAGRHSPIGRHIFLTISFHLVSFFSSFALFHSFSFFFFFFMIKSSIRKLNEIRSRLERALLGQWNSNGR